MSTILVSGLTCPSCGTHWVVESAAVDNVQVLHTDEAMLLEAYRMVRQQRGGTLYVSFADGVVNKYSVCPDFGSAQAMNRALGAMGGSGVDGWPGQSMKGYLPAKA